MPTRRQILRLGAGVAALLAAGRAFGVRADGGTTLFLPQLALPEPTPEPTFTPEPTPEPTATFEPTPTDGPTPEPTLTPTPGPTPTPDPMPAPPPMPAMGPEPWPQPNDEGWLVAPASGWADQAVRWFEARSTMYSSAAIHEIVGAYRAWGEAAGVDWFLALAQCAHETGSLTSWWCARPRRNPAGLGVTGTMVPGSPEYPPGTSWAWAWDGERWREGLSFPSWAGYATPAHLGRLLAYALPAGQGSDAQRAMIDYALALRWLPPSYRGVAPTITGLNGRWAVPGETYGQSILDLARRMREQ